MAVRSGALLSWLAGTSETALYLQRFQATVYTQSLKLPRSTSNLQLVFLEMGRYPMQIHTMAATHAELLEQVGC
jgi:hypothetical protein